MTRVLPVDPLMAMVAPAPAMPPESDFADLLGAQLTEALQPDLKPAFPASAGNSAGSDPLAETGERFTLLVPGAFHPRSALQKKLMTAEPHQDAPALLDSQVQHIPTRAASPSLLALLLPVARADTSENVPTDTALTATSPEQPPHLPEALAALPHLPAPQPVPMRDANNLGLPEIAASSEAPVQDKNMRADPVPLEHKSAHAAEPSLSAPLSLFERMTGAAAFAQSEASANLAPMPVQILQSAVSRADLGASDIARAQATPIAQVPHLIAVEARKLDSAGTREFTIRLDPAELGRIDVRLEVKPDGYVTAIVQADQSATYDLLRQDARGFEQSLADAGLKTNADSLNFSLRRDAESAFAQLMSGERHPQQGEAKSAHDEKIPATNAPLAKPQPVSLSHIDVMA